MPTFTVDNTAKHLPADEYQAEKVADINGVFAAVEAAWSSWTPTWTNLTLGNGVVSAKYRQIGKLVVCRLSLVFGTTTSVPSAPTDIIFSLPVTRAAYGGTLGVAPLGSARIFDVSASASYLGIVNSNTTTTSAVRVLDASGTYGKTVAASDLIPMTWATSDEIHVNFIYEAA